MFIVSSQRKKSKPQERDKIFLLSVIVEIFSDWI